MVEVKNGEKSKKQELEEIQAVIEVELEQIKQIKKSLQSLEKETKQGKNQRTKSESYSNSIKKIKANVNQSSDEIVDDIKPYKTAFTLDESLDFVTFAIRNTTDGSSFSLLTNNLLDALNISDKSSFDDLINALTIIINDNKEVPNPIFKLLSNKVLGEYVEKLSESGGLTSTYKEKLSELFLIYSSATCKKPAVHPSLRKVLDYLGEDNLVCGINYAKSVQGFDQMIIKVEDGEGFRKLTYVNPIELKYRYKNHLSWQVPSQSYNPKIFDKSIKKLLENSKKIGAYSQDNLGNLIYESKSSFGRFFSETRGNAAIIKMIQLDTQLNVIAKLWEALPQNTGSTFPLHEEVPNSEGKTLQQSLEEAMLDQFRLESLAESGFIINYSGSLQGKYTVKPYMSWKFKFASTDEEKEKVISGNDFRVDDKPRKDPKINVYHPDFPEGLVIYDYVTFPLIRDKEFMKFLELDSRRYKIYISNELDEVITSDNEFIVCSPEYYINFKQYLSGEIKTRFVNDVNNNLKLSGWNGIVAANFKFEHDLSFITSNPIPKDYFDKFSGEYRFHSNLHKLKAEHHILGIDRVNSYALRPSIDAKLNITAEWYTSLNNNFHEEKDTMVPVVIDTSLEDPFLDLTKTYGLNIPNPEWVGLGIFSVNTYFASGKYCVNSKYLKPLEDDSIEIMKSLPKKYNRKIVTQQYDVYKKSRELFSRENIHTKFDYTKSISKIGKRKITNEIRAEYLTRQSFDGIVDEAELLVTLVKRNGQKKELVREGDDIILLEFSTMIHRDQINYFPLIRKYSHKSAKSSRYRFEIHTSSPHVLQSIRNNLLDCPWISKSGHRDIENRFADWMERLTKIQCNSKISKNTTQVSLNAFESIWLLVCTAKNMKLIENELFLEFLNYYRLLIASSNHKKASKIWSDNFGNLTLENFRNIYSFGLIGSSMKRYKHRIIYEVMSDEFFNFLDLVYNKCMQLMMYSEKKPYLKWIRNFMDELGEMLY